jgi:thioredoxin 1
MSTAVKQVTDANFATEVLGSAKPVLVDYWAEWCGPCKIVSPVVEQLAASHGDRLDVAKLNIDENQAVTGKYGIRGIPTLMLFKNGEVVATRVGAMSASQLASFVDANL